jgi:hypothetical protein
VGKIPKIALRLPGLPPNSDPSGSIFCKATVFYGSNFDSKFPGSECPVLAGVCSMLWSGIVPEAHKEEAYVVAVLPP